ncbi:MAG: DegV family protein [Eubacteriales bacterium]
MIAIVVDSTANVTVRESHLYGIRIVPASFSVNNHLFKEKYIDQAYDEKTIYSPDVKCATFHPSTVDFHNTFNKLAICGYEIICITISSKLSSAYNSALLAAEYLPKAKIKVVDSLLAVGGLFLLVKKAHALIKNRMTIDEIETALNEFKKKIKIKFTVDDYVTLAKSKRLGFVRRSAEPILNYKPIFYCRNGSIYSDPAMQSARSGYNRIRNLVNEIPKTSKYVIINYIEKNCFFYSVLKHLHTTRPQLIIETRKIGPVVGINIGNNMLAVVWCE